MTTRTSGLRAPKILLALIWAALVIFLVLQVLDVLSTIRFIAVEGIQEEENPLARILFTHYGVAGLWLHKLLIIPFVVSVGCILSEVSKKYMCDEKNRTLLTYFLAFFLSAYVYLVAEFVAIVISNLHSIQ